MKHLLEFQTLEEYSAATINRPSVSLIDNNKIVIYDPIKPHTKTDTIFTYSDSTTSTSSDQTISQSSYDGNKTLVSVEIGTKATSIGREAFHNCNSLTSITIPNSVISIGDAAFTRGYSNPILNSITFESTTPISLVNQYDEIIKIFGNPDYLVDFAIHVPTGYESIYAEHDAGWEVLAPFIVGYVPVIETDTIFTYSDSTTSTSSDQTISQSSYDGNKTLVSVEIGTKATSIGREAFQDCDSLTQITIPDGVTSIGNGIFSGCYGLTSVTIPNSVTSIGDSAFSGCYGLTSVTIPNNVTSIGDYTFMGCSGLISVTIPNNVTSIGNSAFNGCSSLISVTIPNNVTSIGNGAFMDCINIEDMTFLSTTPVNLEDEYGNAIDIFALETGYYGPENLKIHVPTGYEHTYENYDAGWEILTPYIVGL